MSKVEQNTTKHLEKPSNDLIFIEYLINMNHIGFDSFLQDSRCKAASMKSNCYIELTSRTLNKRVNLYHWVKYAILRVLGPDEIAINHCMKMLEKTFSFIQQRKEYSKKAHVTLFPSENEPDNLPCNSANRTGPNLPMYQGLYCRSPYEPDDKDRSLISTPWKISQSEKSGYYVMPTGRNLNQTKSQLKTKRNAIFGVTLIFPINYRPFCYEDLPNADLRKSVTDNRCKTKCKVTFNAEPQLKGDEEFINEATLETDNLTWKRGVAVNTTKYAMNKTHGNNIKVRNQPANYSEKNLTKYYSDKDNNFKKTPQPTKNTGSLVFNEGSDQISRKKADMSHVNANTKYVVNGSEKVDKSHHSYSNLVSTKRNVVVDTESNESSSSHKSQVAKQAITTIKKIQEENLEALIQTNKIDSAVDDGNKHLRKDKDQKLEDVVNNEHEMNMPQSVNSPLTNLEDEYQTELSQKQIVESGNAIDIDKPEEQLKDAMKEDSVIVSKAEVNKEDSEQEKLAAMNVRDEYNLAETNRMPGLSKIEDDGLLNNDEGEIISLEDRNQDTVNIKDEPNSKIHSQAITTENQYNATEINRMPELSEIEEDGLLSNYEEEIISLEDRNQDTVNIKDEPIGKIHSQAVTTENEDKLVDIKPLNGLVRRPMNDTEQKPEDIDGVYVEGINKVKRGNPKKVAGSSEICNSSSVADMIIDRLLHPIDGSLVLLFDGDDIYSSGNATMRCKPSVVNDSLQFDYGKFTFESSHYLINALHKHNLKNDPKSLATNTSNFHSKSRSAQKFLVNNTSNISWSYNSKSLCNRIRY